MRGSPLRNSEPTLSATNRGLHHDPGEHASGADRNWQLRLVAGIPAAAPERTLQQISAQLERCANARRVVAPGWGLMGELIRVQVVPDDPDVVRFRCIFRQTLDREPVCNNDKGRKGRAIALQNRASNWAM
jgi:hypothetical protein